MPLPPLRLTDGVVEGIVLVLTPAEPVAVVCGVVVAVPTVPVGELFEPAVPVPAAAPVAVVAAPVAVVAALVGGVLALLDVSVAVGVVGAAPIALSVEPACVSFASSCCSVASPDRNADADGLLMLWIAALTFAPVAPSRK